MPGRVTSGLTATAAGVAIMLLLGFSSAGQASVSAEGPRAHRATPECLLLPNCVSVYQYGRVISWQFVLQAVGIFSNAPVIVGTGDPGNPGQDWAYIDLGTVSDYQHQGLSGTLPLDRFDITSYGADEVYQLESSPGGHPSGYCAANVANRMLLRVCNGSKFQTFIAADSVGRGHASPASYCFGLSAVYAPVRAHHLMITGSRIRGTRVTFSRPVAGDSQFWQSG